MQDFLQQENGIPALRGFRPSAGLATGFFHSGI
jgi:hypothetical protein